MGWFSKSKSYDELVSKISPGFIDINNNISVKILKRIVADPKIKNIQLRQPLKDKLLKALNDIVLSQRDDITIFNQDICDLSFLKLLSNVTHLSIGRLLDSDNVECITNLTRLKSLTISIFNLTDFHFLKDVCEDIEYLSLRTTKSKKPSLKYLSRFKNLKELYLEGQQKDIEAISGLEQLEKVLLRSISTPNLNYLSALPKLWSVDIKLGGIKNFDGIANNPNIKNLELWQIRELKDISFIETMTGLQFIFLQSLPNIAKLPSLKNLHHLRKIYLENLKGLDSTLNLESILSTPNLQEYIQISPHKLTPADYIPLLQKESIKSVRVNFGNAKANVEFERLLNEYGKDNIESSWQNRKFEFED